MLDLSKLSTGYHLWYDQNKESCEQGIEEVQELVRSKPLESQRDRERRLTLRRSMDIHRDSVGVFLEEKKGFCFDPQGMISSQELYDIYSSWCSAEGAAPMGIRALSWRLKHNCGCYPVLEITLTRNGRRCRGFRGIRAMAVTDNAPGRDGEV